MKKRQINSSSYFKGSKESTQDFLTERNKILFFRRQIMKISAARLYLLTILFILVNVSSVWASHIVGGDITYQQVGLNLNIRLTLYRDCHGIALADSQTLYVINGVNNFTVDIVRLYQVSITELGVNSCVCPLPENYCVKQYVYTGTLNLVNKLNLSQNGQTISDQLIIVQNFCVRNASIFNIEPNQCMGLRTTIPPFNIAQGANFSSPQFNTPVFGIVCKQQTCCLNLSASNNLPPGFTITYQLAVPYKTTVAGNQLVQFNHNANLNNLFGDNSAVTISNGGGACSPQAGSLCITANTPNKLFVGAIDVIMSQNGQELSRVRRDFQIKVVNCDPPLTIIATVNPNSFTYTDGCGHVFNGGTLCSGQPATLNATASKNGTFNWQPGNLSGASVNVIPNQTTTYTVTVTDQEMCTRTTTVRVQVNPSPTFSSITSTGTLCVGGNLQLNINDCINCNTYLWTGPNGFTSTDQNPTRNNLQITDAGIYRVTTISQDGCTATGNVTVVVHTKPVISIASNPGLVICTGQSTNLTASGANTYSWNIEGENTQEITVSRAGIYTVTGTDANGCTGTAGVTVTVNQNPTITISGTLMICNGGSTTLTASGGINK